VLVCAVVCNIVLYYTIYKRFYILWGYQIVACLNYHCKNLANFILIVRSEVSEYVGVKLKDQQIMSSNQSTDKTKHEQLNIIFVI